MSTNAIAAHAAEAPTARTASAKDLRTLINRERASRGLKVVRSQRQLGEAARRHSADMVRRGFASHVSPDGSTLRSRVRRSGYLDGARHWDLGEAIAWGSGERASAPAIMDALMASPAHRAVLLDPEVREVGIGVVEGLPVSSAKPGITVTLDFGVVRRR